VAGVLQANSLEIPRPSSLYLLPIVLQTIRQHIRVNNWLSHDLNGIKIRVYASCWVFLSSSIITLYLIVHPVPAQRNLRAVYGNMRVLYGYVHKRMIMGNVNKIAFMT
jgi:exosortase/archaeosortase